MFHIMIFMLIRILVCYGYIEKTVSEKLKTLFEIEYLFLVIIKSEDDIRPIMSIKIPVIELIHSIGAELDIDMYIF